MQGAWQQAIERARAHSPFLALALERQGELAALLEQGEGEAALAAARETGAGEDTDIGIMEAWLTRVTDANRCYLGMEERLVVTSVLRAFPEEFVDHIVQHACPRPGRRP